MSRPRECTCTLCEIHREIARLRGEPFCDPRPAGDPHPRIPFRPALAEVKAEIQRRRGGADPSVVH